MFQTIFKPWEIYQVTLGNGAFHLVACLISGYGSQLNLIKVTSFITIGDTCPIEKPVLFLLFPSPREEHFLFTFVGVTVSATEHKHLVWRSLLQSGWLTGVSFWSQKLKSNRWASLPAVDGSGSEQNLLWCQRFISPEGLALHSTLQPALLQQLWPSLTMLNQTSPNNSW